MTTSGGQGVIRLGLDVGGTKTHAVAIDPTGQVIGSYRVQTALGHDGVVTSAEAAVLGLLGHLRPTQLHGIALGVGIPGRVDHRTGRVVHAVNLGVVDLELGAQLTHRLGMPVTVENDVNAAALGAFAALDMGHDQSMAYLNLGTGMAAGLVRGGRLWRGSRGVAGEIGHIPVDPDGAQCVCGQRGCLELCASGSAIARKWPNNHERPVFALFAAAGAGDPIAHQVKLELVTGIAAAVRVLALTADVDVVVLGGGVSSMGATLLSEVTGMLHEWGEHSEFLRSLELADRLSLAPTELPVAALGAALAGSNGVAPTGAEGPPPAPTVPYQVDGRQPHAAIGMRVH